MPASSRGTTSRLLELARQGNFEPDAELLARFAGARDEAAFAASVERHGPMAYALLKGLGAPRMYHLPPLAGQMWVRLHNTEAEQSLANLLRLVVRGE